MPSADILKKSARLWLPVIVGVIVTAGSLVLWSFLIAQERANIERTVRLKITALSENIHDQTEGRIMGLVRMAKRWEVHGKPLENEWDSDAVLYVTHYAGYKALLWVDPSLHARWVAPLKGNEEEMNRALGLEEGLRAAFFAAFERREAIVSKAVISRGGGKVFMAAVPIFRGARFEGFIVGVFKARELLDDILRRESGRGFSFAVLNAGEEIYGQYGANIGEGNNWAQEHSINVYGAQWRVRLWPQEGALAGLQTPLPKVVLAAGLLTSLLLALVTYFYQTANERARAAETANSELAAEVVVRKRAEEEIEKHASELARSNAELEQFAYVASHDLQEPLRIVVGYVQLLSRRYRGKLDGDADEFITFAVDGATRMQTLINDILVYPRVGKVKEYRPVDCKEVLERTLVNLQVSIKENDALVTQDPLPTVVADASQLEHLFMNLIGNAIKYRSSDPPRVHVSALQKADEWLFSVKDNGIGIDPRHSERIFAIFQRLHGKGEYPGTGIGLAICRKVVEARGGRIWVESRPGNGSTFYFTMPNKESEA